MNIIRAKLLLILCTFSAPVSAADTVIEEESLRYYFGLMQKAQAYRIEQGAAGRYLRGVWRLDPKAHVGSGHYARADKGDDVSLICNNERLIQVDFNRNHDEFVEVTEQLSEIRVEEDGSLSFGQGRRYIPLDDNHMAVAAYDYIVVLRRKSGRAKQKD